MTNTKFVQVKDYETGNTVLLARDKIITIAPMKVYSPKGHCKMDNRIRVHLYNGVKVIVDAEPTLENMQSLMPL
jgi:hypothetical protein